MVLKGRAGEGVLIHMFYIHEQNNKFLLLFAGLSFFLGGGGLNKGVLPT